MVSISFTVFKDKILDGSKRQTIRPLRKRPFKVGDKLQLYWHQRQKDCELLREETCKETFLIAFKGNVVIRIKEPQLNTVLGFLEWVDLAKRDGFQGISELMMWFQFQYPRLDSMTFQVVRW